MTKTHPNSPAVWSPRLADALSNARQPQPAFRSILVDIDTSARSQPELDLASLLVRRSGAQLRIVDTSARQQEAPLPGSGAVGIASSRDRLPAHRVLIQEARRFGHDLVIRSRERDSVAGSAAGNESVNQQLFRHSPCPVWVVAARPKLHAPRILVAVDPVSGDPVAGALDAGVMRMALAIRSLLGGEIAVLHAWEQPAAKKLWRHPIAAETAIRAVERRAADLLQRFVRSFGPAAAGCRIELIRGRVEQAVPACVVSEGVDIVIAGAPARAAIWRLLFGSTAEMLLDAAPCSVIAFKQPIHLERGGRP